MEQQIESEFWQRVWAGAEALVDQHYSNGSDDDDDDDLSLADTYSSEEEEWSDDDDDEDDNDVSVDEAMPIRGGNGQDDDNDDGIGDFGLPMVNDTNNDGFAADDTEATTAVVTTATDPNPADDNNNDGGTSDDEDEFAAIDRETADVMKERVAKSTREGYERRNITLLIWLYDNHTTDQDIILFHILQRMHVAQTTDAARRTKAGAVSKSRKKFT